MGAVPIYIQASDIPERSRPDSRHNISKLKFDKWRFLAYDPGELELHISASHESGQ